MVALPSLDSPRMSTKRNLTRCLHHLHFKEWEYDTAEHQPSLWFVVEGDGWINKPHGKSILSRFKFLRTFKLNSIKVVIYMLISHLSWLCSSCIHHEHLHGLLLASATTQTMNNRWIIFFLNSDCWNIHPLTWSACVCTRWMCVSVGVSVRLVAALVVFVLERFVAPWK